MARENMFVRHSFLTAIKELSETERGRLFTAMLVYSSSGEELVLGGAEKIIWPIAKEMIDSDNERYEQAVNQRRIAGQNSANGRRKAAAKANEKERAQTAVCGCKPTSTTTPTSTPTSKENPLTGTARADAFDHFWACYPKKIGKEAARRAFKSAKVPLETMLAALETQKKSKQWAEDHGRFIPNPATWLNQGRWADEPMEKAAEEARPFAYNDQFAEEESL